MKVRKQMQTRQHINNTGTVIDMGRVKEIYFMLEDGASINDIAGQLQKWDPILSRKDALKLAYEFMKEWKANGNDSS